MLFADKPECTIHQENYEDEIRLTCNALANPEDVVFDWSRGGGNKSVQVLLGSFTQEGLSSVLTLNAVEENFGTYYCHVNNSLGAGLPCELDVQGLGLFKGAVGGANIIIIVAVIAASIVVLLIILVIVILLCRRRKPTEKCK